MNTLSFFSNISIYEWIILGLYILFFIIQLFYYLYLFRKPLQYASSNNEGSDDAIYSIGIGKELPGISIIITAKNEAENLRINLPSILNQDYPNFQVVVVNNASTDSTNDVLSSFRSNHPNLYITYIPIDSESVNDKKLALTVGIKAAKHDILLFTEPDTKPLSDKWVYEYAKKFDTGIDIVLGCCQIEINKSYFKKFILFDNLFSGVKYISMALAKQPYMGIGRNMAFRKNLFFDNKGFSSVLNIEDGEDNVFINRIATKNNVAVLASSQSMVVTNVVNSLSSWKRVKTKYLATQKYYSGNTIKLFTFELFSRYAFYILFTILCMIALLTPLKILALFAILLFLFRYAVQIIVLNKNSKVYNAGKFYFSLPLFDFLIPIANNLFLNSSTNKSKQ